jgi:hypothetical protein
VRSAFPPQFYSAADFKLHRQVSTRNDLDSSFCRNRVVRGRMSRTQRSFPFPDDLLLSQVSSSCVACLFFFFFLLATNDNNACVAELLQSAMERRASHQGPSSSAFERTFLFVTSLLLLLLLLFWRCCVEHCVDSRMDARSALFVRCDRVYTHTHTHTHTHDAHAADNTCRNSNATDPALLRDDERSLEQTLPPDMSQQVCDILLFVVFDDFLFY